MSIFWFAPAKKSRWTLLFFEGHTTIDTAALTGESMPVSAAEGDAVCSGCVNLSGAVELVVTKPASESTASKNYGTGGRIRFQQGENRTVYHQVRTVLHPPAWSLLPSFWQ